VSRDVPTDTSFFPSFPTLRPPSVIAEAPAMPSPASRGLRRRRLPPPGLGSPPQRRPRAVGYPAYQCLGAGPPWMRTHQPPRGQRSDRSGIPLHPLPQPPVCHDQPRRCKPRRAPETPNLGPTRPRRVQARSGLDLSAEGIPFDDGRTDISTSKTGKKAVRGREALIATWGP
jgi:hypothetical protein